MGALKGGPLCEVRFGLFAVMLVKGIDSRSIWIWLEILGVGQLSREGLGLEEQLGTVRGSWGQLGAVVSGGVWAWGLSQ